MDLQSNKLDEKLLRELKTKINLAECHGIKQKSNNSEMVKQLKKMIEERVKCVCRV